MGRTYKITLLVFLLLVAFLTYLESTEPEPVNWNPSYSAVDKIPLGTFVLHQNLRDQFKRTENVSSTPFEFLSENDSEGTYVFINSQLIFDDSELEKLLNWVDEGNSLFLASDAFSKNLLDTLGVNITTLAPSEGISSRPMMNLVNPDLKGKKAYLFDKEIYHSVFSEIDTLNHTVLGVSDLYENELTIDDPEINYIKVDHGKGEIFLHTTPQAFSNFFLLHEDNQNYVQNALAYLPTDGVLYWDENKKIGKSFQTSPLYILLGNKALKWAYYFLLIGTVLFVIFEGKRKQRSIPVVPPLENQTYHFTRTISGLYLDSKDYKKIAIKKISLFLDYVRDHYRIPTSSIDEDFYSRLAVRTGSSLDEVKNLFQLMQQVERGATVKKEDLLELNSAINSVKNKNYGESGSPE